MGYNVIWIDDEWDTRGTSFIQTCKLRHQIYISPYKTRKEGIAALENNLKYWDAVILDAKAYNNSENEVADLDGMYAARERLIELRQQRHIPCFVLTGQPDLMGDKSFEKAVGKFYDKKKPEEVNQLISDLKEEVSKSNRFQLKSIYHDAVEQLSDISIEACEDVIDILEAMHHPELPFTPKLHFNPLRQALEYVFRSANRVGIIPDAFFPSENVNLNQCFMFLKGSNADRIGMRYGEDGERIIPRHIENMMGLIISLGNVNSHSKLTDSEIKEAESKFAKDGMSSKFLVYSMAWQLCEIASWMNQYIADHSDRDGNLKKCKFIDTHFNKVDSLKGKINKDRTRVIFSSNYIIDKSKGFKENCSPQEYEYKEHEEVLFELRKTTNPKTGLPFALAKNVRPIAKSNPENKGSK